MNAMHRIPHEGRLVLRRTKRCRAEILSNGRGSVEWPGLILEPVLRLAHLAYNDCSGRGPGKWPKW